MSQQLITLPTDQLLSRFGEGRHIPGSGSAAALTGLVGCKLLQTVISLSHARDQYQGVRAQLTLANQDLLAEIEPKLMAAVDEDSIQFEKVITARRVRDAELDPNKKKQLSDRALNELRLATEIAIRVAQTCVTLAETGIVVFDLGFRAARGDSGVAISCALAAAAGCVSIIYLNLISFRGGEWAGETRRKADNLSEKVAELHVQFVHRMNTLRREAVKRENQNKQ